MKAAAPTPRRAAAPAPTPEPPARLDRRIVLALCLLAAFRVFVFSAAFPFFNNVDEPSHYDLVRKYARGDVPRGLEILDAAAPLVRYNSPEYLTRPGPEGVAPPLWTLPPAIKCYANDHYRQVGAADILSFEETRYLWGDAAAGYKPQSQAVAYLYERRPDS